jgi:MarR family transcriptional regulator, transcriptional regulator for hemolysin
MTTQAPAAPSVDLLFLLSEASHALATELTAGLAELDITPREYCVLSKACTADRTQTQIAELAALDKTTMVVTVDRLEEAGLAVRKPSSTDRRARIVAATPEGERVARKAAAIVERINGEVLGALPGGEREALVAGLSRLVEGDGRLSSPVDCEPAVRRPRAR